MCVGSVCAALDRVLLFRYAFSIQRPAQGTVAPGLDEVHAKIYQNVPLKSTNPRRAFPQGDWWFRLRTLTGFCAYLSRIRRGIFSLWFRPIELKDDNFVSKNMVTELRNVLLIRPESANFEMTTKPANGRRGWAQRKPAGSEASWSWDGKVSGASLFVEEIKK